MTDHNIVFGLRENIVLEPNAALLDCNGYWESLSKENIIVTLLKIIKKTKPGIST